MLSSSCHPTDFWKLHVAPHQIKHVCVTLCGMQGFDTSGTETKGTVLIRSGAELETYAKSEEARMEEIVKGVADAGVRIIFSGAAIGEMAMHFLEKYGIMAVRVPSKFDLRRVCRTTGAVAMVKVQPPTPEEVGHVSEASLQELGGTRCVVLRQGASASGVTTIVVRGSTDGLLADVERSVRLPNHLATASWPTHRRSPYTAVHLVLFNVRLAQQCSFTVIMSRQYQAIDACAMRTMLRKAVLVNRSCHDADLEWTTFCVICCMMSFFFGL